MTVEEKRYAGILEEQRSRPPAQHGIKFRIPSDEVRESTWTDNLTNLSLGSTLVICGYSGTVTLNLWREGLGKRGMLWTPVFTEENLLDITRAFATDEQYRPTVGVPKSPKIQAF
jgi:hypothetical protein